VLACRGRIEGGKEMAAEKVRNVVRKIKSEAILCLEERIAIVKK
jgi:hypothetical protein